MSRSRGTYNIKIKSLTSKPQWKSKLLITELKSESKIFGTVCCYDFSKLMLSEAAELACSAEFLKTVTE